MSSWAFFIALLFIAALGAFEAFFGAENDADEELAEGFGLGLALELVFDLEEGIGGGEIDEDGMVDYHLELQYYECMMNMSICWHR